MNDFQPPTGKGFGLLSFLVSCISLTLCGCVKPKAFLPGEISAPKSKAAQEPSQWVVEFEEKFSEHAVGSEPENLFILDGAYAVTEKENDKRLTLPGSPVGEFGLLFGPRVREKSLSLSFSFLTSRQGRRYPSLAAGLGGVRSYRLRFNAATKEILLFRGENEIGKIAFQWESGVWWHIRFQAIPSGEQETRIGLKYWKRGEEEPAEWLVEVIDQNAFAGGKCALWGYPYAGTPIHFDDLKIESKTP
jgi:hypothetical protein